MKDMVCKVSNNDTPRSVIDGCMRKQLLTNIDSLTIALNSAEDYAEDILKIIRDNWEKTAVGYGLTRRQIEEMRPAFSACY